MRSGERFSIFVISSLYLSCLVAMCFAKLYLRPNVRPSIFIFLFVGSIVLSIVSLSFVECSAGCRVNSTVFALLRSLDLDYFVWSS